MTRFSLDTSDSDHRGSWLLHGPPRDGEFLVFGFHYAGTGAASSYRDWPVRLGSGRLCPIQPPGRETRMMEESVTGVRAFADQLAADLAPHLDRPYAFIGHCGAFPYLIETAFSLIDRGAAAPQLLFASSWGAPHWGLYGRLNFLDLDRIDLDLEIDEIARARTGLPLAPELRELAAELLMVDLRLLRGYRYQGRPPVPSPTMVLGWSDDEVVPTDQVWPSGWHECADASYCCLPGDHWEFLRCPSALVDLIVGAMTRKF